MGWCDDINFPSKYNKLIKINKKIHHEKLFRDDYKYDLLIPIKYNFNKIILGKGSCIFIHLTNNYKIKFTNIKSQAIRFTKGMKGGAKLRSELTFSKNIDDLEKIMNNAYS